MERTNKIAFIIPIYPPHYNYGNALLKSFYANSLEAQADLWFVFTNEEEANKYGTYENKIILPEELRIFDNRGIINIKKFYGLKTLQNKYDYYIILDSEIEFIKNIDLYSLCEQIYKDKKLYGNTVWNFEHLGMERIRQKCRAYFTSCSNFKNITNEEKDLYLWFSNLPVYKNDYLQEFFDVIDYKKNIYKLTLLDFEHYIYMYYLVLYKNFKIIDLKMHSYIGAGESTPEAFCFVPGTDIKHNFNMCSKSALPLLDNDNLFVVIQIDRTLSRLFFIIGNTLSDLTIKYENLQKEVDFLNKRKSKKSALYKFFHLYALRGKKDE